MRAKRMVLLGAWVAAFGLLAAATAQAKGPKTRDKGTEIAVLKKAIDYTYNYDKDLKNFVIPPKHEPIEVKAQTKRWFILVNQHGDAPLNLKSKYKKGHRTLIWGTPYDNAARVFTTGGSGHDFSALPRDWSYWKVRKFVTFVCVPPKTEVQFKIGFAAPQEGDDIRDPRPGYGMQVRFKGLPKGTICITTRVFTKASGKHLSKELKKIDLVQLFKKVLGEYNASDKAKQKLAKKAWKLKKIDYFDPEAFLKRDFDPAKLETTKYSDKQAVQALIKGS